MIVLGVIALIAGCLMLFLPETQNQPMPETLEDTLNYPPKRRDHEKKKQRSKKSLNKIRAETETEQEGPLDQTKL